MAAYAALLSLKHIIEQIQHHPRPPISLDRNQVDSLTQNVNFLQDFLEGYPCVGSSKEASGHVLESRIADAAHAAEDIIEVGVVDQITGGSAAHGDKISPHELYQDLEEVIQEMGFIKKDVMEIKENIGRNSSNLVGAISSSSPLTMKQKTMIGFDGLLIEVTDKLTGEQSSCQIISIVGMGGIGKTTLARNAYVKPLIMQHFDIRAWITISQNYYVQDILIEILLSISKDESREILSAKREHELVERVHKSLWGRRYLIVMDDIWSIEVWDKVKIFFPDNSKGSRIMITTRQSKVAEIGSHGLVMDFLDEDKSWDLLCRNIFEEEDCPPELEEIGKKIARNCKGLPLSLVVIGGLLAKSKPTREHWEYISENSNSILHSEDNERCLKVLHLSYNHLPVHLKPCFLYMGVFPKGSNIRVSMLVKLWVSEGFLKPVSGKSLEVVSREYLEDLCERNLILVHQRGSNGNMKFCNIHDLLRELCLREARRERLIYVPRTHNLNFPQGIDTQRHIGIHQSMSEKEFLPQVNKRFLAIRADWDQDPGFPSSLYLLWNLQTLIVAGTGNVVAPSKIWKMTQLRHVEFDELDLPDPPGGQDDDFVLGNLQTLRRVRNFKCGEEVVKRIPNIKKLQICYDEESEGCISSYHLNNLCCLRKLESFGCFFLYSTNPNLNDLMQNLILPNSLKKLTLERTNLYWEDMKKKIGLLPNLQVLKLMENSFVGPEWETVEGQFCNLRFLQIFRCSDLECWTTDSNHFPRLEHLVLYELDNLRGIPSCIGEIATLQLIQLGGCGDSSVISAKRILEEQEELDNVGLRVQVVVYNKEHFESLASPNFQVESAWNIQ